MNRGSLVLAAALVAAFVATSGTGAFGANSAERTVDVAVADDREAYLGVALAENETGNATGVAVTVRNQFPANTTLDAVVVETDDETLTVATDLHSGSEASATTNATCGQTVRVVAAGPDVTVTLERTVHC